MKVFALLGALALAPSVSALAADAQQTLFTSPNGEQEQCLRLAHAPGSYTKKDEKSEAELCSYDIYRNEVAACPKTWSTSPGTMFYATEGSGLTQAEYEAQKCGSKKGHKKLAKHKTTMNQSGTSGTFSSASLLYYHTSRYFQTVVQVPVAVYRTFDKDSHFERVSSKAVGMGSMNKKAWEVLRAAEKNPSSYKPTRELFTPDMKQIYGVLLDDGGGERYGAEINGVRSSWGDAQNNDFQKTPAFTALRSDKPFGQAVQEGIQEGKSNGKILNDLGSLHLGGVQMGLWMRELTEITLLDFIFSQQDRIGNIDYDWYWVYSENGSVKAKKEKRDEYKNLPRNKMKAISAPEDIAQFQPVLVQKSIIADNDAGGRVQYVNYTKRTKMLEKIRHYDAGVYKRLLALNADLGAQGPLYQYFRDSFFLDSAQLNQIVKNTAEATKILQGSCRAGTLRFDLDFDSLITGQVNEAKVDCDNP